MVGKKEKLLAVTRISVGLALTMQVRQWYCCWRLQNIDQLNYQQNVLPEPIKYVSVKFLK